MTTPAEQAQQITVVKLETPKSSQGVFELPCGYIDDKGELHTEVTVREMTGAEEDLLRSKQTPPHKKYGELLSRCVTRIGTVTDRGQISAIVRDLPIGDRVYLLFVIRRVTLGDEYPFSDKCPECGKENLYSINLADIEIKPMPDPKKRIYDLVLPSKRNARFRISTGRDEEKVLKFEKDEDSVSKAILMRLELLDGEPPSLDLVKEMGMRDRLFLQETWNEVEGGVDTGLDMDCPFCGCEFKREVQIGPSFFFPSTVPTKSKKKLST